LIVLNLRSSRILNLWNRDELYAVILAPGRVMNSPASSSISSKLFDRSVLPERFYDLVEVLVLKVF
jgi:hypothetical protein